MMEALHRRLDRLESAIGGLGLVDMDLMSAWLVGERLDEAAAHPRLWKMHTGMWAALLKMPPGERDEA